MTDIPKLGAHVSTAGGLWKAIENAKNIGAQCIQIFGASPRQWEAKMPSESDVKKFKSAAAESDVSPIFLHASYLVNLASPIPELREKSVQSLCAHLEIATKIGATGLIFHMGSGKGIERKKAIELTVKGIKMVLQRVAGSGKLIMENSAGGGDKLGSEPEEMGKIFTGVDSSRVGVCIDTAHAFEAGIIETYTSPKISKFLDEWEGAVRLKNILALHINDSKTGPNSHHDRHENLGEGYIGLSGFKNLAKEKRLRDKAWILEVPGFDGMGPDKRNVDILKGCF